MYFYWQSYTYGISHKIRQNQILAGTVRNPLHYEQVVHQVKEI